MIINEDFFDDIKIDDIEDIDTQEDEYYKFMFYLSAETQPAHFVTYPEEEYDIDEFYKRTLFSIKSFNLITNKLHFIDNYSVSIAVFDEKDKWTLKTPIAEYSIEEFTTYEFIQKFFTGYAKYDTICFTLKVQFNPAKNISLDKFLADMNYLRNHYTKARYVFFSNTLLFKYNSSDEDILRLTANPSNYWNINWMIELYDTFYNTDFSNQITDKDNLKKLYNKYTNKRVSDNKYTRYIEYLDSRGETISDKYTFHIKGMVKEAGTLTIVLDIQPKSKEYWNDETLANFIIDLFGKHLDPWYLKKTTVNFIIDNAEDIEMKFMKYNPVKIAHDDELSVNFTLTIAKENGYKVLMGRERKERQVDFYQYAINQWRLYKKKD